MTDFCCERRETHTHRSGWRSRVFNERNEIAVIARVQGPSTYQVDWREASYCPFCGEEL